MAGLLTASGAGGRLTRPGRGAGVIATGALAAATVVACGVSGFLVGGRLAPLTHNRMFPWIVGRSSGIGAFVALTLACLAGLLFRRPVRASSRVRPETFLRVHTALGTAVVALIVVHIGSLLADRYSGVVWMSLVWPEKAHYRPGPVTFGMVSLYLVGVAMAAALLAGRRPIGRRWRPLHLLAFPAFATALIHGLLAGSDTPVLRGLYIAAGGSVVTAVILRSGRRRREMANDAFTGRAATSQVPAL